MNKPVPFFTVGVPTINRADSFLPKTLKAILAQSFEDFEVLVSDNASTDNTEAVVKSFGDPRIRYVRRNERLAPGAHFAVIGKEAAGRYFVLNQDDDLLHRDFLKRAHEALTATPGAVMYAAPVWREVPRRGYLSRMMRPKDGYADWDRYLLEDRFMVVDGKYAAVKFLDPILHFVHPAVVIDCRELERIGGYSQEPDCSIDLLTQARVLMNGCLAYDTRPGAITHVHDGNYSRTMPRRYRKLFFRQTYETLLSAFEASGMDWKSYLAAYLDSLNTAEIIECLHEWTYYRGPYELQKLGMECLSRSWSGTRRSFYRKCLSRIGTRNLMRFYLSGLSSRSS